MSCPRALQYFQNHPEGDHKVSLSIYKKCWGKVVCQVSSSWQANRNQLEYEKFAFG